MNNSDSDLHVIYLTKNCDLRCKYCYEGLDKKNEKIDIPTLEKTIDLIIEENKDNHYMRILFFGGEVFLHFNALIHGLEYIAKKRSEGHNISACLTTNGTLITEQKVFQLFKYNRFLTIELSFDGRKETHDKYRVFKSEIGSFDILEKKAKIMLKYFPFTTVRMTVSNVDDMYDDAMFLADYGFRSFCIQGLRGKLANFSMEDLEKFETEIERIKEQFKTRRNTAITSIQPPCTRDGQTLDENIKKKDDKILYKYFLPNGDAIYQKPYNDSTFEHFSNGKDASYNLLNKKEN